MRSVAHVVCPDGMYGAERWILAVGRAMARRGTPPLLVTIGASPGAADVHRRFAAAGLPAVLLPWGGKLSPGAIRALRRLVREHRIEVLHTHEFKSDVFGWIATRGLGVALVSTPHGWAADEGPRIAAYEAIDRAFLRGFDRILPLGRTLRDDLVARGFSGARVELLENAVDDEPLEAPFRAREAEDFALHGRIVFLGRLVEPKGVFELVEGFAAARLPAGMRLVVAGEGGARESMERRAAALGITDRVTFAGYVEDVPGLLREADAVVLPSYSEGLPRVLLEASAAGVPIVASDIPGIRDLVVDGENGLLVPPRDAPALAAALGRLFEDGERRVRLIRAARRRVEERHTADRLAAELAAAYDRVC